MKLVDDWKTFGQWYSTHVAVVQGAIAAAQAAFSTYGQPIMQPTTFAYTMIAFVIVGTIVKLIDQGGTS